MKKPSVTQLLPPIEWFCTPEQLEAARQEGNKFHAKMEWYLASGETFEDPEILSADKVLRENKNYLGKICLIETRLETEKFTGKPDAVFELAILDYKRTLGNKKYHALQLAGYHILAVENKIIRPTKKWYVLYGQGKAHKLVNVYDERAEAMFLACLKKHEIDRNVEKYLRS